MIRNFIKNSGMEYFSDVSLKNYNTYRIDIKAKYLVFPRDAMELSSLVKVLKENNIKFLVLGNGSNVIFACDYYDGVIIKLDKLNDIDIKDNIVEVGAGYSLVRLANDVSSIGLSGLEFASAIPGCVGASVAMNAGAYNHSLSEVLVSVLVLNSNYELVNMSKNELDFDYRDSFFKHNNDYIIVSCKFKLEYGNKEEMMQLISARRVKRIESQPLNYPSAGSVFRNPEGLFAGKLIEDCGLKGYKLGGAMISLKHANFIINYNKATGKDIINLINKVKRKVKKEYNIELVMEQIIVD